jgi:HAD superfamily 5'-nucleotidase-like hydrolase
MSAPSCALVRAVAGASRLAGACGGRRVVAAAAAAAPPLAPPARGISGVRPHVPFDEPAAADASTTASALLEEWAHRRDSILHGHSDLLARMQAQPRAHPQDIFANTDLMLDEIDVYGFDLDYTLVPYADALQELIYKEALRVLVEVKRYPAALLESTYDPTFPTRGVVFDGSTACLLKLDATQHVEVAFHGRRELSRAEVLRTYPNAHVRLHGGDASHTMRFMSDIFCYPEAALAADIVEYLTRAQLAFAPPYVYSDVVSAIGEVHRSGALYRAVLADPGRYIRPSDELGPMLERMRRGGKRTFIITNSPYGYANGVLTHMLGPMWLRHFDLVVTSAEKPAFYTTSRRPFRRVVPESGRVDWQPVESLLGGGPSSLYGGGAQPAVFQGGNLAAFVAMTGWQRVLYLGDHVESDMRDPRRFGWRTAMIVKELKRDVEVSSSDEYRQLLAQLLEAKDFLANLYTVRRGAHRYAKDAVRAQLLDEIDGLKRVMRSLYASKFGSVFSSADQSSLFGLRLFRWCDGYTSKLTNLAHRDLDEYLSPRSTTGVLPHDVRVVM